MEISKEKRLNMAIGMAQAAARTAMFAKDREFPVKDTAENMLEDLLYAVAELKLLLQEPDENG